jgi:tetratricopeptide (TPR) repeat protein
MYDFQRVLMITGQAKVAYDKDPSKLMTVVNFAIVAHFVDENERLARVLYRQALDLSDSNPLVIRAYAIFLLGICEAPVAANREKGIEYFADANRRDKTLVKFDLAYLLLKYAVYVNPRKSQALLNLALAEHFVYKNKLKAEKCLRRALVLDPFNERMVELWKYFKGLYNERANLYYPPSAFEKANTSNGSKKSLKQGRTVLEDPSWAGWCYVERDEYGLSHAVDSYWFHITSGESSWTQPDFEHEWKKRMLRSKFEGAKYGMEYYFDPYTSTHFQYHPLSDTYR